MPRRILAALSLGYVLQFWSDVVFSVSSDYAGPIEPVVAWLLYAVLAYALLCVVTAFRVHSIPMLAVAGAIYGWLREGVVADAMFADPPLSLAWPALPWHALLAVCVGWYGVTRAMQAKLAWPIVALCAALGIGWGLWSAWRQQGGFTSAAPLAHWLGHATLSTALLIAAHALFLRARPSTLAPTAEERWAIALVAAAFFLVARVAADWSALLALPCFAAALVPLSRHRRITTEPTTLLVTLDCPIKPGRYATLALLPLTAAIVREAVHLIDPAATLAHLRAALPAMTATVVITTIAALVVAGVSRLAPDQNPDRWAVLA